jgi:hypothetical protein
MSDQNSTLASHVENKKSYTQPLLVEYGDINEVTRNLEPDGLLSVSVVVVL